MSANPWIDNMHRKHERWLKMTARKAFKIKSTNGRIPRKRKKYMYKVERQAYIDLLRSVAEHLARQKL